ncbi:MAG: PEP-CTERM sorting domain-containing protein [Verrucomicrobiota bacterium]
MRNRIINTALTALGVMALFSATLNTNAATVTVDPGATWLGFMNVSDLPANGGAYMFGSSWGTADLNASFSGINLTLTPNTSISRDIALTDTYWWTAGGEGNKTMAASMYVENDTLAGQTVNFVGSVLSYTLVSPYTSVAFIKDFAPDYSSFNVTTASLADGDFNISLVTGAGRHIQYGFETVGPNARLDEVAGFGSAQVTAAPVPEPSVFALAGLGMSALLLFRRRN